MSKEKTDFLDFSVVETKTKSNQGVWMTIKHPYTGEETKTRFCVLGYDSDVYTKHADENARKIREEMFSKIAESSSRYKKQKGSSYADEEKEDDLLILVQDWENVYWDGKELPFSKENLKKVLESNKDIRMQIKYFIEDTVNFFLEAPTL